MTKLLELLMKYRNLFLLSVLMITLAVSSYVHHQQMKDGTPTVDIPVTEVAAQAPSALEAFRQQRDQEALQDIAALEQLIAQVNVDEHTREAAAAQLREIIGNRQAQAALEGALLESSLSPCVAVVSGGNVTIVTQKSTVTGKDSALVISLAQAHAGAAPENVHIISAK